MTAALQAEVFMTAGSKSEYWQPSIASGLA